MVKEETIAKLKNKLVTNFKSKREGHALDRCCSSMNQQLIIRRA